MATECDQRMYCKNSKMITGTDSRAKCAMCRFSPDNIGRAMAHYWSPTDEAKNKKHPDQLAEKRKEKVDRHHSKLLQKRSRDGKKRQIARQAGLSEKRTESQIIKATKNSGRRNKDGDHVHLGMITLDTKLQTTRENPVISLVELEKVRADAARAGKLIGGLVIRNRHNVGCVVLKEEDYAILIGDMKDE